MSEVIKALATIVFSGMGVAVAFNVPFFGMIWALDRRRKRFRAEALEPFTELPLRPPGESLRLKIETLTEEFESIMLTIGLLMIGGTGVVIAAPAQLRVAFGVGLFLVILVTCIVFGRKLARVQKQLWNYRLGFTGERVVGEELNQLLAKQFEVFHDVPFDGFNIDHVLVGPPGVYAVETKAVRKRAAIKGLERATVYSDGTTLTFPTRSDTRCIEQARRNAEALSKWLTSATGERVVARPILTLPGWRVERTKTGDVNVLRPDEIKRSFKTPAEEYLSAEQIQRIAHQLTERCRLPKAA